MNTVGDRIRRARVHRGLSGEELAIKVGYKTQSGISNLENRTAGSGGHRLPKIAEALNVSLQWLLSGPDNIDISQVPPSTPERSEPPRAPGTTNKPAHENPSPAYRTQYHIAHELIDLINEAGIQKAIGMLELVQAAHPRNETGRADHPVSARPQKAA